MHNRYVRPGRKDLPPTEAWLIDPNKEKIQTPVDDRGLILDDVLINLVKATLSDDVTYSPDTNTHHYYWPRSWYKHKRRSKASVQSTFRGIGRHMGVMPVTFHKWLHEITIPPELPEIEVMEERTAGYSLAKTLWKRQRDLILTEKERQTGQRGRINFAELTDEEIDWEYMYDVYQEHFGSMEEEIGQLVNQDLIAVEVAEDPLAVFQALGHITAGLDRPQKVTELLEAA